MSSARAGEFPCYARIVNERTGKAIFFNYVHPSPTFALDGGLFHGRARIRCAFPEAGIYTVQIWFFQEHGNDIIKGEMPFVVKTLEENP